jgi:hypothetical protein
MINLQNIKIELWTKSNLVLRADAKSSDISFEG